MGVGHALVPCTALQTCRAPAAQPQETGVRVTLSRHQCQAASAARRQLSEATSAAEAESGVAAQGVELLVFLEGHTQAQGGNVTAFGALQQLAGQASLVVTEDMPTSPYEQWLQVPAWFAEPRAGQTRAVTSCKERRGHQQLCALDWLLARQWSIRLLELLCSRAAPSYAALRRVLTESSSAAAEPAGGSAHACAPVGG